MLLSAVPVLVDAQTSSEIPERLMNNPVYGAPCKIRKFNVVYSVYMELRVQPEILTLYIYIYIWTYV
jgi:hypothetical protein